MMLIKKIVCIVNFMFILLHDLITTLLLFLVYFMEMSSLSTALFFLTFRKIIISVICTDGSGYPEST